MVAHKNVDLTLTVCVSVATIISTRPFFCHIWAVKLVTNHCKCSVVLMTTHSWWNLYPLKYLATDQTVYLCQNLLRHCISDSFWRLQNIP